MVGGGGYPDRAVIASVVSCDNVTTIPAAALGRQIGLLLADQELELTAAIRAAFDLD